MKTIDELTAEAYTPTPDRSTRSFMKDEFRPSAMLDPVIRESSEVRTANDLASRIVATSDEEVFATLASPETTLTFLEVVYWRMCYEDYVGGKLTSYEKAALDLRVRRANMIIAAHPNANEWLLRSLSVECPDQVLRNPVITAIAKEDPAMSGFQDYELQCLIMDSACGDIENLRSVKAALHIKHYGKKKINK